MKSSPSASHSSEVMCGTMGASRTSFDDILELENLFYIVLYHGNRALGSPVLCCIYAVQVDESSTRIEIRTKHHQALIIKVKGGAYT